jgi:DNA-directed RNA polymerase subunit RPC12/RpoP
MKRYVYVCPDCGEMVEELKLDKSGQCPECGRHMKRMTYKEYEKMTSNDEDDE